MTIHDSAQAVHHAEGAPTSASRAAGAGLSFVVGAIYGAVGTVIHQGVVRIGEVAIPVALILALIGAAALLIGFRLLFAGRLAVLSAALGLVGTIALFSVASSGGTVLIPQGVLGLVWTVGPVLLGTVVVAWPRMPEPAPAPAPAASAADRSHRPEA